MERDRSKRRLRTVYPPPEPLPAHQLLGDVDDPLGRVLWSAVRDAADWAVAPGDSRTLSGDAAAAFREHLGYATRHNPEYSER